MCVPLNVGGQDLIETTHMGQYGDYRFKRIDPDSAAEPNTEKAEETEGGEESTEGDVV